MIKDYIDAQENIKKLLLNLNHNNRLTHAYIFSGEKGVGKKEMALYFAAMLYCKEEEPCFSCQNCKQIFALEHPNVYHIAPDGNSIKKSQIESLQIEFSKTSLVKGPRVYIIEDAYKMNASSANSLLKFIEEPTGVETYAILLCDDITNLLPTIVSRCGHIHFKSLEKNVLLRMLVDNGITNEDAEILKELTNNIDEAIKLSNSDDFISIKSLIEEFLDIKDSKDGIVYLRKNLDMLSNKIKLFLELLALLYEDLLHENPIRFPYLTSKMTIYKSNRNKSKIMSDLEIILNLKKRLDSNVIARNILTNLFLELF